MEEKRKYEEREAPFTTKLEKWCRYNFVGNWVAEVKVVDLTSNKKTFNYNSWLKNYPHQFRNLKIAKRHFLHKWSDASQLGTPLDLVSISSTGYLMIQYQHSRQEKEFYIIDVCEIEKEINSGSKSLTEQRAKELAFCIGYLK
jgi:hypothetical protein